MMVSNAQRLADRLYVLLQGQPWPTVQLALALMALQFETRELERNRIASEPEE